MSKTDPLESMKDILPGMAERYAKREAFIDSIVPAMTDPNKAAVTESNSEFIARMKEITTLYENPQQLPPGAFMRLLALAEERVMIEEHEIVTIRHQNEHENWWEAKVIANGLTQHYGDGDSLSAAIHAVVAKIGEGNG